MKALQENLRHKKECLDTEIKKLGYKDNTNNVKIIVAEIHVIMNDIQTLNKT